MENLRDPAKLAGRILLAVTFLVLGYGKIGGYDYMVGFMESGGLPGMLLPVVILFELVGGVMIVLGFFSRYTALAFAVFCVLTALIFHFDLGDSGQKLHFVKNLSIAGGMLMLFAYGPGKMAINDK